jgi:hypothetical protein
MGFDIGRLDAAKDTRETGVEMTFLDPRTGDDTGAVITVAAYTSERVKAKARAIVKEWERKRLRTPNYVPGMDEQERYSNALVCAAVVDWRGFVLDGKDWPCTPENIERLVSDPAAFRQIDTKAGDETAFFGN